METIAQEKVALRSRMREKLAALIEADARAKSAAIWERLAVLPAFTRAARLLIYVSTGKEAETHGLIQQLLAMGRQVYAPAFDSAERRYVARTVQNFHSDLAVGQFGILEPKPGIAQLAARDPIDVALVPGLAFDEKGNRLGRGMGYFDRLLPGIGGTKIALAYDFQILKEIPAEAHDARVDFIVTEIRVVETKGNRP